jgi:hypothetical protein
VLIFSLIKLSSGISLVNSNKNALDRTFIFEHAVITDIDIAKHRVRAGRIKTLALPRHSCKKLILKQGFTMKITVVSKAILLAVLAASANAQSATTSLPQLESDRGGATFTLSSSGGPGGTLCNGDGSVSQITVVPVAGFTTPVQFSSAGLPAVSQLDFSSNPVTPSSSTTATLSIINTIPGLYSYDIVASAAGTTRTMTNSLVLFAQTATAPTSLTPATTGISASGLVFNWVKANTDPSTFTLTLRNTAGIVHSANVTGSSYALPANVVLTPNTSYTWSLGTTSPCPPPFGSKGFESINSEDLSSMVSFTTAP